jgi:LPS export ABC transporter protein LptC
MTRRSGAALALWFNVLFAVLACNEATPPPVVKQSFLPDSAEQMLFGVRVVITDQGVKRASLRADTGLMYDDNTRAELRRLNTTFYTAEGEQNATLTSERGTYNIRLETMEARGNVVVVSDDGRKLETPHLRYDPSKNEVSSDSAFTLTEAERVTQGVGFLADPDLTRIQILKVLKVSGQTVTLPKR